MKVKIVSFDMYGTLVNRMVQRPGDMFVILEKRFNRLYHHPIENFAERRAKAERELRKNGVIDLNLEMIYGIIDGLSEEEKKKYMELELQAEYDLCYPNQRGVELYRKACAEGKKVIVITDMYLPEELLKRILEKCGINNVSELYISGCIGKSKAKGGALFRFVQKTEGVSGREILHIGDNPKSDYLYACLNRYRVRFIRNTEKESYLSKFINSTKGVCINYDEWIGYSYFGALSLGYVSWIYKMCCKEKIEALYFFSREGLFIKKLFDALYKDKIKTRYLFVSRRSLSIPLVQFCNSYDELINLLCVNHMISVRRFLSKLSLDEKQLEDRLKQYHIDPEAPIGRIPDKNGFFRMIKTEMEALSSDQFENIKMYFERSITESKIGVVDIGWTGTMQSNFIDILDRGLISCEVIGFFVGQKKKAGHYITKGMRNYGYLFSYKDKYPQDLIISGEAILEIVFFADHGTTESYDKNGPLLGNMDLSGETRNHLQSVQAGIVKFAMQLKDLEKKYHIIRQEDVLRQMEHLFRRPETELVEYIGEWDCFDDRTIHIAAEETLFPIHRFMKGFLNAGWRVGFLKRNIKINIPYFELIVCLKRLYGWLYKTCDWKGK